MKKGEISTSYLVGIILTLMGAVVLILVITSFNWNKSTDQQVCKSSVSLRGTLPEMAKGFTPLNCKTEKLCISAGGFLSKGDNCKDLFQSVEEIESKKISSKEFISESGVDAKTEIEKIIAKKVIECWETMGAGKISIENSKISESFGLGKTTSFCVICSRIDIDNSVLEKYNLQRNNLSIINPFEYMKTRKYPQTNGSYLDYVTGTGSNGRGAAFGGDYIIQEIKEFDGNVSEKDVEDNEKEFKQLAIVFSQASSPETSQVWTNYLTATLVGGVGAYKILPVGALSKFAGSFSTTGVAVAAGVFALAAGAIQVNVWNNQALTASYCGDLTNPSGAVKGCSVVRVVPYDAEELTAYCGVIDGYP